jgi:quinolinate synthase
MEPALYYSVPDFVGDSLDLSRRAAQARSDIIVFCGVRFMAETAKILNPTKTVLLPSEKAGCSLAASITAEDVRALKRQFPGVPVVTYVNTYADVKAESDICCTSSNAVAVVQSLNSDTVIFLPDEYLASNVARETGKRIIFPRVGDSTEPSPLAPLPGGEGNTSLAPIPGGEGESFQPSPQPSPLAPLPGGEGDSERPSPLAPLPGGEGKRGTFIGWRGRCEVHEKFTVQDIRDIRAQFPEVAILAHPECSPEVTAASDFTGSTNAMIRYVQQTQAPNYLLLTECAMGDNIAAANPDKEMLRLCSVRCPHMNQITLEDTLTALQKIQYVIEVPEEIRVRARRAVERMIAIG